MAYLFGDTYLAQRRLDVLADTFAESSRAFLLDAVDRRPGVAVDLGCGPGHSTRLVAETVHPDRTVGLDNSGSFLAAARETETEAVSFRLHDITKVPFPMAPFDLAFCRFGLTHLEDPQAVVGRWATQLGPRGILLLEEVESIETTEPVLLDYLTVLENVLRLQDNRLYIGPLLGRLTYSNLVTRQLSRVRSVRVQARRAAEMFSMNIQVWRRSPIVAEQYPAERIDQLEQDLEAVAKGQLSETVNWGLRQIVMERVG